MFAFVIYDSDFEKMNKNVLGPWYFRWRHIQIHFGLFK